VHLCVTARPRGHRRGIRQKLIRLISRYPAGARGALSPAHHMREDIDLTPRAFGVAQNAIAVGTERS
jgi:hypothetical protein